PRRPAACSSCALIARTVCTKPAISAWPGGVWAGASSAPRTRTAIPRARDRPNIRKRRVRAESAGRDHSLGTVVIWLRSSSFHAEPPQKARVPPGSPKTWESIASNAEAGQLPAHDSSGADHVVLEVARAVGFRP